MSHESLALITILALNLLSLLLSQTSKESTISIPHAKIKNTKESMLFAGGQTPLPLKPPINFKNGLKFLEIELS